MREKFNYKEYKDITFNLMRQEYRADVVEKIEVVKNNNKKLEGLCFSVGTNAASPIVYYDDSKEIYTERDVEKFLKSARRMHDRVKHFTGRKTGNFYEWKIVRQNIFPKVISYEKNSELLLTVPYVRFLDLAVTYFCNTSDLLPELGEGAVTVTRRMKEMWGISEEQLMETAMTNLKNQYCSVKNLEELAAAFGVTVKEGVNLSLYVMSTYNGVYGAAAILNKEVFMEMCERLDCSKLWIIPSSVHELIVLPYEQDSEAEKIYETVVAVNKTLQQEDFLADSLYIYDNDTQCIEISKEGTENGQA